MKIDLTEALRGITEMGNGFLERLPYIVIALVVFVGFYFLANGFRSAVRKLSERRKRHQNIGFVLGRLAQGAIIFLGLLIGLVIALPSFKPAQLISFLGITSVAIGFAFRDILENFLAGILLLWNEPFKIGDQITVGSHEGMVEDIQIRATMIRTYDGRRAVIPNSDLFSNAVTVNTAYDRRRVEADVGIGYGDDITRTKELILEAVGKIEGVLSEPAPEALVFEFGGSSVNLRVRWWIAPPRRREVTDSRDRVLTTIKTTLLSNGIDLPFPTQHVLFHDQTEESDGDRARQREGWPAGKGATPRSRTIAAALDRRENGK